MTWSQARFRTNTIVRPEPVIKKTLAWKSVYIKRCNQTFWLFTIFWFWKMRTENVAKRALYSRINAALNFFAWRELDNKIQTAKHVSLVVKPLWIWKSIQILLQKFIFCSDTELRALSISCMNFKRKKDCWINWTRNKGSRIMCH